MQVIDIYPDRREEGCYQVRIEGAITDTRVRVYAKDELEALATTNKRIKDMEVNERFVIVGTTISVLALFALVAYGCSQPSFRETCIKAGKRYVDTSVNSADVPDIEACV